MSPPVCKTSPGPYFDPVLVFACPKAGNLLTLRIAVWELWCSGSNIMTKCHDLWRQNTVIRNSISTRGGKQLRLRSNEEDDCQGPTVNASRAVRTSMPSTLRRPKAGCAPTWPLPTCTIFFPGGTNLRCLPLILGAARERLPFAWRNLAFTSRCWIPLRRCWISRSARHGKQGFTDKVILQHGDATQLADLFPAQSFDVILSHNILEYCDDPGVVLRGAARALRDSSAILSVLVRNQAGESIQGRYPRRAICLQRKMASLLSGDRNPCTKAGCDYLRQIACGAMLTEASLAAIAERGIRALADYLPPRVSRSADYEQIFELERKLGSRPEFCRSPPGTHTAWHVTQVRWRGTGA